MSVLMMYMYCYNLACDDGNVRLMNGSTSSEGRVEICYNGRYETVCDDFWDEIEARIVCKQLNFTVTTTSKIYLQLRRLDSTTYISKI